MWTDWEDLWAFAIVTPLLFLALILLVPRALTYLISPPSSHSPHCSHSFYSSHPTHPSSPHSPTTTPAAVPQPSPPSSRFSSSPSPHSSQPPSPSLVQTITSSLLTLIKSLPSPLLALLRLLLHIYLAASHSSACSLSLLLLLYLCLFPWQGEQEAAVGHGVCVAHQSMAGGGCACTRGCCCPSADPRVPPAMPFHGGCIWPARIHTLSGMLLASLDSTLHNFFTIGPDA
ncbi:unnamed protein product [Closterium sp. Yama58-4]|nr:unnamed protein product [Closterium sp. Yama58-4]